MAAEAWLRRPVVVAVALLLALIGAALGLGVAGRPPASPNVLIIVTDDQPVGSMGVMPATRRIFGEGAPVSPMPSSRCRTVARHDPRS